MKIAVVGAGQWGPNLVRTFHGLGVLSTVCDVSELRLQLIAESYPAVKTVRDYSDVLLDKEIDAVAISTPANTHFELTRQALIAKKDVFVEKPLSLHYGEGKELVNLARQCGNILMVGHLLEYHPAIRKLRTLVTERSLGDIRYIYSNRLNLGRVRKEENCLWSFAPHDIAVILSLAGQLPEEVTATGGAFLQSGISDVTIMTMRFPNGIRSHVFVSWLHPYKEQRLVIIGSERMAAFNDLAAFDKLMLYDERMDFVDGAAISQPDAGTRVAFSMDEPLRVECQHFIECAQSRREPFTGGESALRVLRVLDAAQQSLQMDGIPVSIDFETTIEQAFETSSVIEKDLFAIGNYYVHPSSVIDEPVQIGDGTQIWHFCHIMSGARIGANCVLGQNVFVAGHVVIGDGVKIQNNVSIYDGVELEDNVFVGPSAVFTNVKNPRSHIERKHEFKRTLVRRGTSIGANATIVCGITIGEFSFIGAGAVVTHDVPSFAMIAGVPARIVGWVCECGVRLAMPAELDSVTDAVCAACQLRFEMRNRILARR